jgi:hypothetical protein
MEREPAWRTVLNYGCVIYFLGLPAVALVGAFAHFKFESENVAKFLTEFHFAVTAIVAAIAGLNSFDRRTESHSNGNRTKHEKTRTDIDKRIGAAS